jgi:hypothetical protein
LKPVHCFAERNNQYRNCQNISRNFILLTRAGQDIIKNFENLNKRHWFGLFHPALNNKSSAKSRVLGIVGATLMSVNGREAVDQHSRASVRYRSLAIQKRTVAKPPSFGQSKISLGKQ